MPELPLQIITLTADIVIFLFVGFYLIRVRRKEKEIDKKTNKIDSSFHQIVDDALSRERKILADATAEADQIILDANSSKGESEQAFHSALQQMMQQIQHESIQVAAEFMDNYTTSLKGVAETTLVDFQNITKGFEGDMQKQITLFRESLLPTMEKELENYKQMRLKQSEETISRIVQKVSQEVLNKTLSMEDHNTLLINSLEKAKSEGIFN